MSLVLTRSRRLTARLASVQLDDVPQFVRMAPDDPRRQGAGPWRESRRGRLTASGFANALGFFGADRARRQIRDVLQCADESSGDDAHRTVGSQWGMLHERSAALTYLTAFLLPRSPQARLCETGFWPSELGCGLGIGASPDGIIEGADEALVGPGGSALFEAKCPWNGGLPRPRGIVDWRQLPQLQGTLLATQRSVLHLISWAPTGAFVFEVRACSDYQQLLQQALAGVCAAAAQGRSLTPLEAKMAASVEVRSKELARQAKRMMHIQSCDCIVAAAPPANEEGMG